MKRILTFILMLLALTACIAPQTQGMPESATTNMPQANLPNPASVYCEQNGNKHEIVSASDGNQSGICVFPDGSTCDEWAYYRGECGPAVVEATVDTSQEGAGETNPGSSMPPGAMEAIVGWWGVIKSTEPGAQFDDYFERQGLGQIIYLGIDSMDPAVKSQIEALRDSGKIVHLYGTLISNVPDYNGSQIVVDRLEVELVMDFILHGYCGVYCGACPILLATEAGTIDGVQQCYGCKSAKPTGFCATCGIKACAQRKGFEFCDQCDELITCELMRKFVSDTQYPYGQCVLKNIQIIREEGIPQWLEMQAKRWRCKNCGTSHSWYHETCPQCGQAVASYKADIV